ncbi:2-isopropylmalate synthase [Bacilli bacterium]|nr:2-isopropylmalate synthase [Bacilli bacterium]
MNRANVTKTYSNGKQGTYFGTFNEKDGGICPADGKYTDIQMYNKDGIGDGVYTGSVVNGLFGGKGVRTYKNGDKYEGEWKDGKKEGKGVMTYADGRVYDGEWKGGNRNGQGTLTFKDGQTYTGDFVNDKMEGKGIFVYPNGEKFEGHWKDGWPTDGKGIYVCPDGDKLEFIEDGKVKITQPGGGTYEGEFTKDVRSGNGRYEHFELDNGNTCTGGSVNGVIKDGTYKLKNRTEYIGTININPNKTNEVNIKCNDGREIDGTFSSNGLVKGSISEKKDGKTIKKIYERSSLHHTEVSIPGVYVYKGVWADDKMEGNGTLELSNRTKYTGVVRFDPNDTDKITVTEADREKRIIKRTFKSGALVENEMEVTYLNGGGVYIGGWVDGKPSGDGLFTRYKFPNIGEYTGTVKNGTPNGTGKMTQPQPGGGTYEGEWKDGVKSGVGHFENYKLPNGNTCVGDSPNGVKEAYIYKDTGFSNSQFKLMEEEWKDGKRTGKMRLSNEKYIYIGEVKIEYKPGETKENKNTKFIRMNGNGIITYKNGEKFEGTWEDGYLTGGTGIYTLPSGNKLEFIGDGEVKVTQPSGGTYEGGWKHGVCAEKGKLTKWVDSKGNTYNGDSVDGKEL